MENPIQMDDLGVPLFLETSIYTWLFQLDDEPFFYIGIGWKSQNIPF